MDRWRQFIIAAALIIGLLVVLGLGIPRTHFATSVLDLLPEGATEVKILRELAEQDQGRLINVRLYSDSGNVSQEAAAIFTGHLRSNPTIEQAWIAGSSALEEAGTALFANRYQWLLPSWLDKHFPDWRNGTGISQEDLARQIVGLMDRYLESPEGMALAETIPSDPYLLMGGVLDAADQLSSTPPEGQVLLWVRQKESPFTQAGQEPVFQALSASLQKARALQPDLRMEYSGVARFAAESKAGIKSEIERLNILGLLFILLVTLYWVRSAPAVARIVLVVGIALLAAAATVITAFPSVHVISLVIGSILTGIAVDYAFHLILTERRSLPEKAVIKAVITGSLSSAAGFIILLWAALPFLRQVGAFVGAGLLAALIGALILRPSLKSAIPVRSWHLNPFSLRPWTGPVLVLLFLPGLQSLDWKDRINDLEYPLPELKETEHRLRQLSSIDTQKSVFLVHGKDAVEARDRLAQLQSLSDSTGWLHPGEWIPTLEEAQSAQNFFRQKGDMPRALRRQLERRDYLPDAFAPHFAAWAKYIDRDINAESYEGFLQKFASKLPGPLGSLVHHGEELSWFMVMAPPGTAPEDVTGILELDQEGILSDAFGAYRETMIRFSGFCLVALSIGVILAYGIAGGTAALVIPLLAILLAYGLSGYLGTSLGLFHIVGTLLAFCIGLDYALFAVEAYRKHFRLPGSISISALTTLGVFAILATSQIPAVRQLASTVLTIIAFTLLMLLSGWPLIRRGAVPGKWSFKLLPHGEQALYVQRVETVSEQSITALCNSEAIEHLSGEWMVEAMAQAAAVFLAYNKSKDNQPRSGMLVVVQECRISESGEGTTDPISATVESLTDASEGLLLFKGICRDNADSVLAEASFSIFIPPEERAAESKNG